MAYTMFVYYVNTYIFRKPKTKKNTTYTKNLYSYTYKLYIRTNTKFIYIYVKNRKKSRETTRKTEKKN